MSLPDTAEYWWDVKGYNRNPKHIFHHIKGVQCGHFHVWETDSVSLVDCHACKKILAEMPEIKKQMEERLEKRLFPYGKCKCGGYFKEIKSINTMSTDEKAKELLWKFLPLLDGWTGDDKSVIAKQCALICCDEIVKEIFKYNHSMAWELNNYWQEVKQKINSL